MFIMSYLKLYFDDEIFNIFMKDFLFINLFMKGLNFALLFMSFIMNDSYRDITRPERVKYTQSLIEGSP